MIKQLYRQFHEGEPGWLRSTGNSGSGLLPLWWVLLLMILIIGVGALVYTRMSAQFSRLEFQQRAMTQLLGDQDVLNVVRERLERGQRATGDYFRGGGQVELQRYRDDRQQTYQALQRLDAATEPATRARTAQLRQLLDVQLTHLDRMTQSFQPGDTSTREFQAKVRLGERNALATTAFLDGWHRYIQERMLSDEWLPGGGLLAAQRGLLAVPVVGAALCVMMLLWLARQIQRRERLQRELHTAAQLWHGTLESLQQGVGMYDMEGRLMLWNRRFAEIHKIPVERLYPGIPLEDVIRQGAGLRDRSYDDDIAEARASIQVMRAGQSMQIEHLRRDDGRVMHMQLSPMDADHYVLTITDLTEIRHAEQRLRDQATRLAAIMDTVPDAIVTINASGSIESWSAGAQQMFGYTAADVLRRNVTVLMTETHASQHDNYLRRYLQEGSRDDAINRARELVARHSSGREFPINLRVREMQIDGRRMFVGIIRDLTGQRAMERLKEQFIATVSHELRTPLTSISAALALLSEGDGSEASTRTRRLVDIAIKNSQRLASLTNDILDLEKTGVGKFKLELQPCALRNIVEQSVEANRAFGLRFQVRLRVQGDGGDSQVHADEKRLLQVLANLLSNAIKFSPADSEVLVECRQRDGWARVTVHDDGPGIPVGFREHVFEPFSQADDSDARRGASTGLGLAITRQLVERQGGRVGFDSGASAIGKGQGASLWFELPVWAPAGTLPAMLQLRGNILLCEDDPDIAILLEETLSRAGCQVECLATAAAVSDRLAAHSPELPELLIVDVNLPGQDGLTLVRQLRQQPRMASLQVIVLSALTPLQSDMSLMAELRIGSWLCKPVDRVRLLEAVQQMLPGDIPL